MGLILLSSLALAEDPAVTALRLEPTVTTLENGLTVVVHEDHRSHAFATSLMFGVGASEDVLPLPDGTPGSTGKAHFFEHLMFEGSVHAPEDSYDTWLADAGAVNNAWTDNDWTTYNIQGPPEALELALWLESDRMGWLELTEEDVDNQRGVIANERRGDEGADSVYPNYALNWTLWPEGHPYRWPVLGTMRDIERVPQTELDGHFRRWYVPSNAVLVVVGDVDTETVLKHAARIFGEVPAGQAPERATAPENDLQGSERWVMEESMAENQLWIAWPTVTRGHADEPALDMLALILSGGRGTRLDDRLYFTGRANDVQAWTWNGRLGGEFVIFLTRSQEPVKPLLRQVDREIAKVQKRGVKDKELERIQSWWRTEYIRALEDMEFIADGLAECFWTFGDADCLDDDLQRYLDVTPADIQRVAQTHLGEDRVLLSVAGGHRIDDLALPESSLVGAP